MIFAISWIIGFTNLPRPVAELGLGAADDAALASNGPDTAICKSD
jgi:hypothetical protein